MGIRLVHHSPLTVQIRELTVVVDKLVQDLAFVQLLGEAYESLKYPFNFAVFLLLHTSLPYLRTIRFPN